MSENRYSIKSELCIWRPDGASSWHFLTIPVDISDEIKFRYSTQKRGFGSIRVGVTTGNTSWKTSLFPDKKSGSYLLPIKSSVRKNEEISVRDIVEVDLEILA